MTLTCDSDCDDRLLARFVLERDESAFTTLVERHGALVLAVALRMLRRREDAEDAFQATFLVLARRATCWRPETPVAAWLHGVTVRVCLNQRRIERRRRQHLAEAARVAKKSDTTTHSLDLRLAIDEQLAGLPPRFREVVVMCDLEGRELDDIAHRLAIPLGTAASRLSRGRERLRQRLARHGLLVAVGATGFHVAFAQAATALPTSLVEATARHATAFAWGAAAARTTLSLQVTQLAEGALRAMMITRVKTIVCFVGIVAASMFGGAIAPDIAPEWTRNASAAPILVEDFKDGDATDGTPANWRPYSELGLTNGTFDASSGDFVLTPNSGNDVLSAFVDPPLELTKYSIRTRLRNTGPVSTSSSHGTGMLVNGKLSPAPRTAIDFGVQTNGVVYLGYHTNGPNFALIEEVQTDLRPIDEDVILQIDAEEDGSLSVFAWRAGDPMPAAALIEAVSPLPIEGSLAVYANPAGDGSTGIFRYVSVAETHIVPEPGSRTLCAIGSGLLVAGLMYGRRRRWAR